MSLLDLKSRIDASAYVVDPALVADAVLRREGLRFLALPIIPSDAHSPSADEDPARRMS